MKRKTVAVVVASLALLTACSGDPEPEASADAGGTSEESAPAESAPAEDATEDTTEEGTEGTSGESAGGSTVLIAMVGTEENPEDFVITLTTEDGTEVTELPAGDYSIQVTDPAATHNFHLMGGSVDETTSVPETEDVVWDVTLEPGEYTYKCDPHPPMSGSFTVTG